MNKIYQQINYIRKEFPILRTTVNKQQIVYFDNAATTQKPQSVIDSISTFYTRYNANVHRGKHALSMKATEIYDWSRKTVADYLNAGKNNIIFTKGTTDSLNLVAFSYCMQFVKRNDIVLITEMEHHSNMLPFQVVCKKVGATLIPIPITDKCDIDLVKYAELLKKHGKRIKLVSVCHVSNAVGTVNPIKEIIDSAHKYDIPVCIDAAQSIGHCKIDVNYLDCDFLAFSGHKCYAPTGIGVLFAKEKYLLAMQPYQFGGGMIKGGEIKAVTFDSATWADIPEKFEAGTPNIEGAISLGVALDNFIRRIGIVNIFNYEKHLLDYCVAGMRKIPQVKIVGEPEQRAGLVSFTIDNVKNETVCVTLNQYGIATRNGFLCTIPLMHKLNLQDGVTRVSFAIYNTQQEIDRLLDVLNYIAKQKS